MKRPQTEYEKFESTPAGRRSLLQEELIFNTTEALYVALEESSMTKAELAKRLGRTRAFVTQLLGGGRNLTLRTLADVADALDHDVSFTLSPRHAEVSSVFEAPTIRTERFTITFTGAIAESDRVLVLSDSDLDQNESREDVAA